MFIFIGQCLTHDGSTDVVERIMLVLSFTGSYLIVDGKAADELEAKP